MTRRSTSSLRPTNTCSRHVCRLQMEAPHCWRTSCCCSSHPVLLAYTKSSTFSVALAAISVSKDLDWNALHLNFLKLPRTTGKILLVCLLVEQTSSCTCVELIHTSCNGVFQTEYSVSAPGVMSPQCGAVLHVLHWSGLSPLLPLCVVCTFVLALQHATTPSSIALCSAVGTTNPWSDSKQPSQSGSATTTWPHDNMLQWCLLIMMNLCDL